MFSVLIYHVTVLMYCMLYCMFDGHHDAILAVRCTMGCTALCTYVLDTQHDSRQQDVQRPGGAGGGQQRQRYSVPHERKLVSEGVAWWCGGDLGQGIHHMTHAPATAYHMNV